jgi:ribulose 1,5-bisphosphate synthetase/thiazole synthase
MTKEKLVHLSCKLCMLFLLVTAQRCQTLHVIKISDIILKDDGVIINISSLIKQSRKDFHLQPIVLRLYPNNT